PGGAAADGPGGAYPRLGFLGEVEIGGLVWMRSRLYDPATGQFVSTDPLPGVAGHPATSFPYHYADDDPIGFLDPLGLRPVSVADFNKVRAAGTGPQWGNIAALAITVAGGVALVALAPESLLAAAAISAAVGATAGAAPGIVSGLQGNGWNWKAIAKGAIVGGVTGALAGSAGSLLPTAEGAAGIASAAGIGAGSGAVSTGASYGYDYIPGLSTGKPTFDPRDLAWNSATGAAGSGLSKGLGDHLTPETPAVAPADPPPVAAEPPSPLIVAHGPALVPVRFTVPPAPIGFHTTPAGVVVENPPPNMVQRPSGLYVPAP
ncbi:MAG: RHS repeat-associated core domain-containing protein, partial [Acidimicrobiales bacterium]